MNAKTPEETAALFNTTRAHFARVIMDVLGHYYTIDSPTVNTSPEEIERLRREIFVPITNAAFLAALDCAWITAPPNATREQAEGHVRQLTGECMEYIGKGLDLGDFWLHMALDEDPAGHG